MSPTGAVPAQELTQKLEKQERTTLKLQKQLRAYAKQIQELTGKCLHGRELWGWLEGHQPGGRLEHHPASTRGAEFHHPTQAEFPPKRCWEASVWTELKGPDLDPTAQDTAGCDLHSSPPVKREATGPVQELAASAVVPSCSHVVPSLTGPSQAMLAWRMEDEGRIIKAIITGRVWRDGDSLPQLGPR